MDAYVEVQESALPCGSANEVRRRLDPAKLRRRSRILIVKHRLTAK